MRSIGSSNVIIVVWQIMKNDLEQADKIMKLASETFLGLQRLYGFIGDADHVDTRITLKLTIHTYQI